MNAQNPYQQQASRAFWRTGIAERNFLNIDEVWRPAFDIVPQDKVATAGSCFAQHIGRALTNAGFGWTDFEPAPPMMALADAKAFNFGVFSFRTGNIYTTPQLSQWINWSLDQSQQSQEVWEKDGRFYDPFRPQIEPNGFASAQEVFAARSNTFAAIKNTIHTADVFVFTLGLTETWENGETGVSYPSCPGTMAGAFDSNLHKFRNLTYPEVFASMNEAIKTMRRHNDRIRFLLTVSPVPLTATASNDHILTATTYSKSVLRAVAGDLAAKYDFVDYFPSFEIISSAPARAMFYEPNMRSVTPAGVAFVMKQFFNGLGVTQPEEGPRAAPEDISVARKNVAKDRNQDDIVCEEEILGTYNEN